MKKFSTFLVLFFFVCLTCIITSPYFLQNKVPFPGNLLVSLYEPYKSYSWPGYPNGPANKPIGFDNLRIFYPVRLLTTMALKNWSLPLWDPYYFSGNTLLGTYQSAVFHPLTVLFLFLPSIDAWSIIIILQPLLASIFMYFFLRSQSFSKPISCLGGILFGFSGIVIVLMEESFMAVYSGIFLPLILYSAFEMFKKPRGIMFILLSLGLCFSILSGWFQMTLYVFGFSFCWILYLFYKTSQRKALLYCLLAFPIALLSSAIHLFPGLEAFIYSARGTSDAKYLFDTYLVPFYHTITYIAPDFFGNPGAYNYFGAGFYYEKMLYIGVVGIVFALYGVFVINKKSTLSFFKFAWLITLSLGISFPTSWLLLYYFHLPLISTILPSRIFFLSCLSAVILACFGIEDFLRNPNKKLLFILLAVFIGSIIAGAIFDIMANYPHSIKAEYIVSLRNLVIPFLFCLVTFGIAICTAFIPQVRKYSIYFFIVISAISSILFAQKYLFFSDRKFTFPKIPILSELQKISGNNRYLSLGKGVIEDNLNIAYLLSSPEGYDSFFIARYGELFAAANNKGKYIQDIPRADVSFTASGLNELFSDQYQSRLLSLLGIRFLVEKTYESVEDAQTHSFLKRIWSDGTFDILLNTNSFPRAFLVDSYTVDVSNKQVIKDMFAKSTDLRHTVILEKKPQNFIKTINPFYGTVKMVSYQPENVELKVVTNKSSILFLSDNYYPGWQAFVDRKPVTLYRADYSFRAVVVPKGNHSVLFVYKPLSVTLGWWGGIIGILCMVFVFKTISYTKNK